MASWWAITSWWDFFFSSATVATLIGIAAIAAALGVSWIRSIPIVGKLMPENLRTIALCVAIGAFSYTYVAGKFYNDGLKVKQAEWDAAKAEAAKRGQEARDDAERNINDAVPSELRNDRYNRDRP